MFKRVTCPTCMYDGNSDKDLICGQCLKTLHVNLVTEPVPKQEVPFLMNAGPSQLRETDMLCLDMMEKNKKVYHHLIGSIILGRVEKAADGIDLSPFVVPTDGVSRWHIRLTRYNTMLIGQDLRSTNGSFLNGEKLIPHRMTVIKNGDELRLGKLPIKIQFVPIKVEMGLRVD